MRSNRLEAIESRLDRIEAHFKCQAQANKHLARDIDVVLAELDQPADAVEVPDNESELEASPSSDFDEDTFYLLTETGEQPAGDAALVVLHHVRAISATPSAGVTRGDIVKRFLDWSRQRHVASGGTSMDDHARALGMLDGTLEYLHRRGLLRLVVRVMTDKEREQRYYYATPAGMGAVADEWESPGTIPADDFRLLSMAVSNEHNSMTEMAKRFGPDALLRLTKAGLIVRAAASNA